jgi:hypothetical protein
MLRKLNLVARMGPFGVRFADVEACSTPAGTSTWKPIPHTTLIEQTLDRMADGGFSVIDQAHGLARDGDHYMGLFHLRADEVHDDYGLVVALQNSHDKSVAARLGVGAGMYAGGALAFTGEIRFGRKHTPNILNDLPNLISHAVTKIDPFRRRQDTRLAQYKGKRIRDKTAHDLLIRSLDFKVVSGSKLPKVLEHWREPQVESIASDGRTLLRLWHAFGTSLVDCNVFSLPGRTIRLGNLLDDACGLSLPPVEDDSTPADGAEAPRVVAA